MADKIAIFDTTLRDGQQCPGAGMSPELNFEYARLAARANIDVLEAGFPAASKGDFDIVRTIAEDIEGPTICALCQLRDEQVDRTIQALEPAISKNKARLHVYVPVSPALMEVSLGKLATNKQEIVNQVGDYIARAVRAGCEVEFSPEGYSRMGGNFSFVTDLIRAAVSSGATVINCPDTIGGAYKLEGDDYFVEKMNQHSTIIKKEFPERKIIWSVHCHNDFGLALDNSLNGVIHGPARQIEGCINGIGERAGNVSLEQCIMVISQFGDKTGVYTGVSTELLGELSDFVSKHMLGRQPHFPITGINAQKHSSGGHTNAILKDPLAYQPFDPKVVGREVSFMFGPLSGGNHAKAIIEQAGYRCEDSEKAVIGQFIKDKFAERRKGITDDEVVKGYIEYRSPIRISAFDYSRSASRSAVHLEGQIFSENGKITGTHDGGESALSALKMLIDKHMAGYDIVNYHSISDREGIAAKGVTTILVSTKGGPTFEGVGVDSDIEISAMKALVAAMNHAYVATQYKQAA